MASVRALQAAWERVAELNRKARRKNKRRFRPPLFELQPLERRLFLSASLQSADPITVAEGHLADSVVIGTLTDTNTGVTSSNLVGSLTFGAEQFPISFVPVDGSPGQFSVLGGLPGDLADSSSTSLAFSVLDIAGQSASSSISVTVTDAPLHLTVLDPAYAIMGDAINPTVVGRLTDENLSATIDDYSGTIDWGDGNSSPASFLNTGSEVQVVGTHAYSDSGDHSIQVSVQDVDGSTANASGTIHADADPALTAEPFSAVEGQAFTDATVATISDANAEVVADQFTALVEWGDGQSGAGGLVDLGGGNFAVIGSSQYAEEGSYSVGVHVYKVPYSQYPSVAVPTEYDLAFANVVSDAPVSLDTSVPVAATEGDGTTSLVVGTLNDQYSSAMTSDFSGTIDWGDGNTSAASFVPVDGQPGQFQVVGSHAYEEGNYNISVSVSDVGGSTASGNNIVQVIDGPIGLDTSTAATVNEADGTTPMVVATLNDQNPSAMTGDFTGTIDWGDGNTDAASFIQVGIGQFQVVGSHLYPETGNYTLQISVNDVGGSSTSATGVAAVADLPLSYTSQFLSFCGTEGQSMNSMVVGTFCDPNPNASASDFSGTIDWGDGNTDSAVIVDQGDGQYAVEGSHAYAEEGNYQLTIGVQESDGGTSVTDSTGTVYIYDASMALDTPNQPFVNEGDGNTSIVVGVLTDQNSSATAGDFTGTINWGDGNCSAASFVPVDGQPGQFQVVGTHAYSEESNYDTWVYISDDGGSSTDGCNTVQVSDAPLSLNTGAATVNEADGTTPLVVATLTDQNSSASSGDFDGTIDWGDGGTDTASFVSVDGQPGQFQVVGTHAYMEQGNYTLQISVSDMGGSSTSATGVAAVADLPLSYCSQSFSSTPEGQSMDSLTVGTLYDPNPYATAGDFSGSIDWGDGNTDAATIVEQGSGQFCVVGSHAYAEEGNYQLTVSIYEPNGGASVTDSTGSASVYDASISLDTPNVPVVNEGDGTTPLTVGVLNDDNPSATASDFTGTIYWGDGNSDAASFVPVDGQPGQFQVVGTHGYSDEGSYYPWINVSDDGGSSASTGCYIIVTDAPISLDTSVAATVNEADGCTPMVVATLNDQNSFASTGDFSGTINWGDGTTGAASFVPVDGQPGQFQVVGTHAYSEQGNYTLQISVSDVGGSSTSGTGVAAVADQPLSYSSQSFSGTEGQAMSNVVVGTFYDPNSNASASDFTGSINWGDGNTDSAIIVDQGGGQYAVEGSHAYAEEGTYQLTIGVQESDGGTSVTDSTGSASIYDASITLDSSNVSVVNEGDGTTPIVAATLTDQNPSAMTGDFTGTIDWGDGNTSAASFVAVDGQPGQFQVVGSHAYEEGNYNVSVSVSDVGGATASGSNIVQVTDAPISLDTSMTAVVNEGDGNTSIVAATLNDQNPSAMTGDFTGTIDWGDGSNSAASFIQIGMGQFQVVGSHAYEEGNYNISVSVSDLGGSIASGNNTVQVTDAPISLDTSMNATVNEADGTTPMVVATLNDQNSSASSGDFTGTIDWGDGSNSAASFSQVGTGQFQVIGSHLYPEAGNYTLQISVSDIGGSSTSGTGVAAVADLPLSYWQASQVFSGTEGQSMNSVVVGTFCDPNPYATASDFTGSINWGDGNTDSAIIVDQGGGQYAVEGSHAYVEEGNYQLTIGVQESDGGASVTDSTGSASITDACIALDTSNVPVVNEGDGTTPIVVGTLNDQNPSATAGDFTGTIDWGDGSTGAASFVPVDGQPGQFQVVGTHAYIDEGSYYTWINVSDDGGSSIGSNNTVQVSDAPLSLDTSVAATVNEADGCTPMVVATLNDQNSFASTGDFSGTINWGDGSTDAASFVPVDGQPGQFQVIGSHLYPEQGNYSLQISVTDVGGSSTSATGVAAVADLPLNYSSQSFCGTEGQSMNSVVVGTFCDPNPYASASDFTGSINWGDGNTDPGIIVDQGGGQYAVEGSHAYAEEGSYQLTIGIQESDSGTSVTDSTGSVSVYDASIALDTSVPILATEGDGTTSLVVATLNDQNSSASSGDFSGTIDWGDGNTSAASFVPVDGQPGEFQVVGSNAYGEQGNFTLQINVYDFGGASASANQSATVLTVTAAPSDLSAVASSAHSIDLTWTDNSDNESGFFVERSVTPSNPNSWMRLVPITNANATSFTDSGLADGSKYYYRVRAHNALGDSANVFANATTPLPSPSSLAATTVSASRVSLAWIINSNDQSGFIVQRSINGVDFTTLTPNAAATATTYNDTGLNPGTIYYYQVEATNSVTTSAPTTVASATTIPATPTNVAATATTFSSIALSWNASSGATSYTVLREGPGQTTYSVFAPLLTSTTDTDATVSPGNGYSYEVQAVDAGGASPASSPASATTPASVPAAPSNLSATASSISSINLAWTDNSDNESGFKVERSLDQSAWTPVTTTTANANSFTDTGMSDGSRYYYRVRATNSGGDSANSNIANAVARLAAPANLTATAVSASEIDIAWTSSSANETGFVVQRSLDGSTFTTVTTTSSIASSYADTSLSGGIYYYYRVAATNALTTSVPSTAIGTHTMPASPMASATAASATQINVSWTDVTGETGFKVERSPDGSTSWTTVATPGAGVLSFSDASVVGSTSYYYRVSAEDVSGWSAPSAVTSATTTAATAPAMVANLVAIGSASGIALQWSPNSEADLASYYVLRSASPSGPFTLVPNYVTLTASAYNDTSAPQGVVTYYEVLAANTSGLQSVPATASATRLTSTATTPTNVSAADVTRNGVLISWNGPQGVTYTITRNGTQIAAGVSGTAYLDSTVAPGTGYTYAVVSVDGGGNISPAASLTVSTPAYNSGYASTPPAAPASLSATADTNYPDSEIDLTWPASTSSGVTEYEIDRDGVQIGATSNTSFTDGGLDTGHSYAYSVKAYDAGYNVSIAATTSGTTGADTIDPNLPEDLQTPVITSSSISLSWTQPWDNMGVTHYDVKRTSSGTTTDLGNVTATSIDDSGLTAGTSYQYEVIAIDAAGNKSSASSLTVTTSSQEASADLNQAANQYIPAAWQTYFYNTLTPALRQRASLVGMSGKIPAAQGWLDGSATVIIDQKVTGLLGIAGGHLIDNNGNGQYDQGEIAWVSPLNEDSTFHSDDTLLAGATPPVGAIANSGLTFADFNGNGSYDPGEAILTNVNQIKGIQGELDYRDLRGSGHWDAGDPIWMNSAHDNKFHAGDDILYNPAGATLQDGVTWGKTNGLNYYDVGGDSSKRIVWVDHSTFNQDFANFYSCLEAVTSGYGNPDFSSDRNYNAWTPGAILNAIGAPTATLTGSISLDTTATGGSTAMVTGSGTHFTTDLKANDNLLIEGRWFTVGNVVNDTKLFLAQGYYGPAISGAAVSVNNWTQVPTQAATSVDPAFKYQRGQPDQSTLIFPKQFQELHDYLSKLTAPAPQYGIEWFTQQSSQQYISLATKVINAYTSVFGIANTQPLRRMIETGGADPGSIRTVEQVQMLQQLIIGLNYGGAPLGLADAVYVRDPNSQQTNHWKVTPDWDSNNPVTIGAFKFDDPLETAHYLSEIDDGSIVLRSAGSWSNVVNNFIDPTHLQEIQTYADDITANGLWIDSGSGGTLHTHIQNVVERAYSLGFPPTYVPPLSEFSVVPSTDYSGGITVTGGTSSGQSWTEDITVSITLPAGGNPLGGEALTTPGMAPTSFPVDLSGDGWGQTTTFWSITAAQAEQELELYYPAPQTAAPGQAIEGYGKDFNIKGFFDWTSTSDYAQETIDTATISGFSPSEIFGLAGNATAFTYNASNAAPTLLDAGTVPTDPLPLTSQMASLNKIADTEVDGIVQAPADLTSFGNDTGSIAFQAQRDMAQSYIPLFTDNSGKLPINGYLVQGQFGASAGDVGSLASNAWTFADENQSGTPYAYSLDERLDTSLLINDASNHIKRVEVTRPGGNSVVFDFAWDDSTSSFKTYGTPTGINQNLSYVLRSVQSDPDGVAYQLMFPSGIVHNFLGTGTLFSVGDSKTGLAQTISPANSTYYAQVQDPYSGSLQYRPVTFYTDFPQELGGMPLDGTNPTYLKDTTDSYRYNITFNWSGGRIDSIDYQTKDLSKTIHTAIAYTSTTDPAITSLTKSIGGSTVNEFTYSLTNPTTLNYNGVTVTRTGSFASGNVTLATTLPSNASFATGSNTSEAFTFNSRGLLTQDALTLSEGGSSTSSPPATTTYEYSSQTGQYDNGAPKANKVLKVTNPDGSWVGYAYDSHTGWVTDQVTPFKSSSWSSPADDEAGDTSSDREVRYAYAAANSGNGEGADPSMLVERPRDVISAVEGIVTGETFYNYDGTQVITRQALTGADQPWAAAGMFSGTQITGFDTSLSSSAAGYTLLQKTKETDGSLSYLSITYGPAGNNAFGQKLSQSDTKINPFGNVTSTDNSAIGSPYTTSTATTDAFGRATRSTSTGGGTSQFTYTSSDWFGPSQVTGPDGGVTRYTYTPLGQVATKVIYAGTSKSVKYSYVYDAAGHVVSLTQAAVDSSGSAVGPLNGTPQTITNTYAYDAQGRLTNEVDNSGGADQTANRTTTYAYSASGGKNITTISYPPASSGGTPGTEVDSYFLDGSPDSTTGTAVTPAEYTEGVVVSDTTDASGRIEKAGSTWTQVSTDSGNSWTDTYTNVLGQVYLVQQSDPGTSAELGDDQPYSDAATSYDASGRVTKQIALDGTTTRTIYDPMTGQVAATWDDVVGDGTFDPGIDSKTVYTPTPITSAAATPAGTDTKTLSNSGTQDVSVLTWNGGLNSSQTVDGMTTSSETFFNSNGYTNLVTYDDGTQTQNVYTNGLLTEADQVDNGEAVIASTTYDYTPMRWLQSSTDYTGATTYAYFQDGTQQSATAPGHNASTSTVVAPATGDATSVTNPDGTSTQQTQDNLGDSTTQSGAGVLPATLVYDTANTDQLTSLTTYQSNTLGGAGAATTSWIYDPNTGDLKSKTYANGKTDTYLYNAADQLAVVSKPGLTGTYSYNDVGQQVSSTFVDSTTGLVNSAIAARDDLGRPQVTVDTDNGKTFSTIDTYTSKGDLSNEIFGSAGGTTVSHGYYATTGTPSNGSPDAPQSLTVTAPTGQSASQTYAYNGSTKRLQTITVNGITLTYNYLSNSNQISSTTAAPADGSAAGATTTFNPDASDPSRLSSMTVLSPALDDAPIYDASYSYNQNDQRINDNVTQTVVGNSGNTTSQTDALVYAYDSNHANALTQVTDNGTVTNTYAQDGVGNFTGTSLGNANSVNQYSNLTYNGRGDETNDGTDAYGYDALDRLISVTPDSPTTGSTQEQYGYDGQGRMLWEDVNSYSGSWVLSTTYRFAWSGNELIAKLDGNNNVLQSYTWGPGANGQNQVLLLTDYTGTSPKTDELIYDASGNVAMMVNPLTGAVVASYSYAPYGAQISATGPDAALNPWGAKGYWTDKNVPNKAWAQPATAYGTNRVVDLNYGVWLQNDPQAENGGFNLKRFLDGDPINNVDPDGLSSAGIVKLHYHDINDQLHAVYYFKIYKTSFGLASGEQDVLKFDINVDQPGAGEAKMDNIAGGLKDTLNQMIEVQGDAKTIEFVLNNVPGGTGAELVQQGKYGDAALSVGVDVLTTVGPGRLFKGGKALISIAKAGREVAAIERVGATALHVAEEEAAQNAVRDGIAAERVTGDALKAARKEFESIKPQAWIAEAAKNPQKYSADQLARMKTGLAPLGSDGFSMEIHHKVPLAEGGANSMDNFEFLTRTDHRLGPNYKVNHPNLP